MSAGETVTVVTPILGRIQCAPGFATTTIYVTIVDDQPISKTAQPDNQHFCMVKTPSMGTSFMLVEYPHLNRILRATSIRTGTGGTKVVVEPVCGEQPLMNGGELPRDFGKEYQYHLEQTAESLEFYIYSNSDIDGPETIIQTGFGDNGGQENQPILVDMLNGVTWETFSFDNPPQIKRLLTAKI